MDNFKPVEFDQVNGDTVSRKSLLEEMCLRCNAENEGCPCEPPDCFVHNVIEEAPAVDTEPVRHGHWIERAAVKGQVFCSECSTLEKSTDSNYKSRRCPNCGAIMDGGT